MKGAAHGRSFSCSVYIVQLITPSVPAMAVSTVMRSLRISFQFSFIGLRVNNFVVELRLRSQCD